MVARVQVLQVGVTASNIRNLGNTNKLKLRNTNIWVNNNKIKLSQDIEQTVKNINKFTLKTNVKAQLESGRLVLETNKHTLRVNDPGGVLEHLVNGKQIGKTTDHYIQLVRTGRGNVRFLYNTGNKSYDSLILPPELNRKSLSGIGNIHIQPEQENAQEILDPQPLLNHNENAPEDAPIEQVVLVDQEAKVHVVEVNIENKAKQIDNDNEMFELWKKHYEEYTENLKRGKFKEMANYNQPTPY